MEKETILQQIEELEQKISEIKELLASDDEESPDTDPETEPFEEEPEEEPKSVDTLTYGSPYSDFQKAFPEALVPFLDLFDGSTEEDQGDYVLAFSKATTNEVSNALKSELRISRTSSGINVYRGDALLFMTMEAADYPLFIYPQEQRGRTVMIDVVATPDDSPICFALWLSGFFRSETSESDVEEAVATPPAEEPKQGDHAAIDETTFLKFIKQSSADQLSRCIFKEAKNISVAPLWALAFMCLVEAELRENPGLTEAKWLPHSVIFVKGTKKIELSYRKNQLIYGGGNGGGIHDVKGNSNPKKVAASIAQLLNEPAKPLDIKIPPRSVIDFDNGLNSKSAKPVYASIPTIGKSGTLFYQGPYHGWQIPNTNKYLFNKSNIESARRNGTLLVYQPGFILDDESILHASGYNVRADNGLSQQKRLDIVRYVIRNHVMTKKQVENHLSYLINRNRGNPLMENAVGKWEDDLSEVKYWK